MKKLFYCPNCEGRHVQTKYENIKFNYGEGKELSVHVPVRSCLDCEFEFLDYIAENTKRAAICAYILKQKRGKHEQKEEST